jgi:N-acetylglutamate synthase-like GNAT family acetyltransferase
MKFLKDNSVLVIQEAKVSDAKDILDFLKKVKEESHFIVLSDSGVNKSLEEQEAYLKELKNKTTSKIFLGKVNNGIVASGGIYHRENSPEGNVVLDINVLNDFLGLGTEEHMLNHVINYARITAEIKSIDILTTEDNQDLISIYNRLGFKQIQIDKQDVSLNPESNESVYRLVINP